MKTINNIHVISKGTILSLVLHMFVIGFVVVTGFNTSVETLTGVLLLSVAVASFYVGSISDRYAEVNGIIVALLVSLITLLYLSFYIETSWKVNEIFLAAYVVIGFIFSLLSRLTNKKINKENKANSPRKATDNNSKKVTPTNAKHLNNKTESLKPKKHVAQKSFSTVEKPAGDVSAPQTVSKKAVKTNTKPIQGKSDKGSKQASIREQLVKEIELEKMQRKSKK